MSGFTWPSEDSRLPRVRQVLGALAHAVLVGVTVLCVLGGLIGLAPEPSISDGSPGYLSANGIAGGALVAMLGVLSGLAAIGIQRLRRRSAQLALACTVVAGSLVLTAMTY